MNAVLYGASDDLIEVEGDVTEEFQYGRDDEPTYVAFSTGDVFSIEYGRQGIWRIAPIHRNPNIDVQIEQATDADSDNYSDRLTLTIPSDGKVMWVLVGHELARKL